MMSQHAKQDNPFVYVEEGTISEAIQKKLSAMGEFKYGRLLGEGACAKVYNCLFNKKQVALKIQSKSLKYTSKYNVLGDVNEVIMKATKEVEIMRHLQDLNLSPRVHCFYILYSEADKQITTVILMEKLEMLETLLITGEITPDEACLKAVETIDKLIDAGVTHSDYKWNNLGYRKTRDSSITIVPFDFGMSRFVDEYDVRESLIDMDRYCLSANTLCLNDDIPTSQNSSTMSSQTGNFDLDELQTMIDALKSPTMESFILKGDMFHKIRDKYCWLRQQNNSELGRKWLSLYNRR